MTARKCALEECDRPIYRNARYKWTRCCCIEHGHISAGRILSSYRQRMDLNRVKQLAAQGRYASDVAEEFNVSLYAAWQFAKKHGVEIKFTPRRDVPRPAGTVSDFWQQHNAELIAEYEAGTTLTAIAKKLGVTRSAVAGRLTRIDRIGERKFPVLAQPRPLKLPLLSGCMWPIGEDWCGDEVKHGQSYCEAHTKRAYRPTAPLSIEPRAHL